MISESCAEVKLDRYPKDQIIGYHCQECFFDFRDKETIVQLGFRVAHLHKVHNFKKKDLPKEYKLEESEEFNSKYLLVLKNTLICPHCDQIMFKYVALDNTDFERWSCQNKLCKYKKAHNSHYTISELVVPKGKFYCSNPHHVYNSDTKPCNLCAMRPMLDEMVGKINRVLFK